jgi:hypothetical protein
MENRHVSPESTLKKPVESAPQLDNVPDVGHSEAACADVDAKLGAATTSIKTMIFNDLMLPPILSLQNARFYRGRFDQDQSYKGAVLAFTRSVAV